MIQNFITFAMILLLPFLCIGQNVLNHADSVDTQLHFAGDFRFRVEHDWNSQKSDGSFRNDRSRLRYRFRFGINKNLNKHYKIQARIRTGNLTNQQGPHVTLGKTSEFGLTSLGFEKANIQYKKGTFWAWAGKNSFPFWKQHELLWNDNVFPEGISMGIKPKNNSSISFSPTIGHFIINSNGMLFKEDQYLSAIELKSQIVVKEQHQLVYSFRNLFFHNIANIPDGKGEYFLNYNILTSSIFYQLKSGSKPLSIGVDWYQNTTDYTEQREKMEEELMKEKSGMVVYLKYGQLKSKGDFQLQLYYAKIGKYAIVDYFAQNDWARWDYGYLGSSGSRLSNFKGVEVNLGYKITDNTNIVLRFFKIQQLIPTNVYAETGSRIRVDLNTKF